MYGANTRSGQGRAWAVMAMVSASRSGIQCRVKRARVLSAMGSGVSGCFGKRQPQTVGTFYDGDGVETSRQGPPRWCRAQDKLFWTVENFNGWSSHPAERDCVEDQPQQLGSQLRVEPSGAAERSDIAAAGASAHSRAPSKRSLSSAPGLKGAFIMRDN